MGHDRMSRAVVPGRRTKPGDHFRPRGTARTVRTGTRVTVPGSIQHDGTEPGPRQRPDKTTPRRTVPAPAITADLRGRAAQFEQQYGRAPSQRDLVQASNFKTRAAKEGALDFAQLQAGWADKLARTLGVSLASIAPSVWHGGTAGTHEGDPRGPGPASIRDGPALGRRAA